MVTPVEYMGVASGEWQEAISKIYAEYQKRLAQSGGLDFDDLLFETVRLFNRDNELLSRYQEQIKYLLIDEYQDTNSVQYKLAKLLSGRYKILPLSAICPNPFTLSAGQLPEPDEFEKDYPNIKEIKLERNYRSNQPILDAAHNLISRNKQHPVLKLWTDKRSAFKPKLYTALSEKEEAGFVVNSIGYEKAKANGEFKFKDFSVLYRTNAQSRIFEEALLGAGIPYILVGGIRFYERAEIKDCLSYLRLIYNPADKLSLTRVLKIGQKRYQEFRKFADNLTVKTTRDILEGSYCCY